jgi:hypothetical protein
MLTLFRTLFSFFWTGVLVFGILYGATNDSDTSMLMFGQATLTLLILIANTYVNPTKSPHKKKMILFVEQHKSFTSSKVLVHNHRL